MDNSSDSPSMVPISKEPSVFNYVGLLAAVIPGGVISNYFTISALVIFSKPVADFWLSDLVPYDTVSQCKEGSTLSIYSLHYISLVHTPVPGHFFPLSSPFIDTDTYVISPINFCCPLIWWWLFMVLISIFNALGLLRVVRKIMSAEIPTHGTGFCP